MSNCIFCGNFDGKKFDGKKLYVCEKCEKDRLDGIAILRIKNKTIKLLNHEINDNKVYVQYYSFKMEVNRMFYDMLSNPDKVDCTISINDNIIKCTDIRVFDYEIDSGITKVGFYIMPK